MDDLWGSWFAGFTAGEGCFIIVRCNEKSPCACYRCRFKLGLRDDDKSILEEIHDTLEMGVIYDKSANTYGGLNHRPSAEFRIDAIKDCAELVKLFDKYPLRAKKQNDFHIWKQAVAELQKPLNDRDPLMLDYYFHKIKEVRQYEVQEELSKPIIKELQLTITFK